MGIGTNVNIVFILKFHERKIVKFKETLIDCLFKATWIVLDFTVTFTFLFSQFKHTPNLIEVLEDQELKLNTQTISNRDLQTLAALELYCLPPPHTHTGEEGGGRCGLLYPVSAAL